MILFSLVEWPVFGDTKKSDVHTMKSAILKSRTLEM